MAVAPIPISAVTVPISTTRTCPKRTSIGVAQHNAQASRELGDLTSGELFPLVETQHADLITNLEGHALFCEEARLAGLETDQFPIGWYSWSYYLPGRTSASRSSVIHSSTAACGSGV